MIDWVAHRIRRQVHVAAKPWHCRSEPEKFLAAERALERAGGHVFTLNLGEHVEASATAPWGSDPTRFLSDRINKALKAEGLAGLPYVFILEKNDAGRLHAHGAVATSGVDLSAVKRALLAAAGAPRVVPAKRARLLKIEPFRSFQGGAEAWWLYTSKPSPVILGKRRIFISTPANKLARDWCDQWQAYLAPKPMNVTAHTVPAELPKQVADPDRVYPNEDALAALSPEERATYEATIAELDAALAAVPADDAAAPKGSTLPGSPDALQGDLQPQLAPSGHHPSRKPRRAFWAFQWSDDQDQRARRGKDPPDG